LTDPETKTVLNIGDVESLPFGQGDGFAATIGASGKPVGMEMPGCMPFAVEPGKTAFPLHVHHANEEMFVIVEGTGKYVYGAGTYPIRARDMTLKCFGISTKEQPEVVEYPNSNKFAVFSQSVDGTPMTARLRNNGRTENTLDYRDGEAGA